LADPANSVFVSVIPLWEILIKCRIGKLKIDVAMMIDGLAPKSKLHHAPPFDGTE